MRVLYQRCKLVHGDLSEYNILYHEVSLVIFYFSFLSMVTEKQLLIIAISCWQGHMYIIDVSQSVDLDHPHALDFLREDCVHVSVSCL